RSASSLDYGALTLNISGRGGSGDVAQTTNSCGTSVAGGTTCSIGVTFTPSTAGARTGALTITDNAAGSPQSVPLSGTGTVVSLSPSYLTFGPQLVGTTSPAQAVALLDSG